jgi:hypothetical protein
MVYCLTWARPLSLGSVRSCCACHHCDALVLFPRLAVLVLVLCMWMRAHRAAPPRAVGAVVGLRPPMASDENQRGLDRMRCATVHSARDGQFNEISDAFLFAFNWRPSLAGWIAAARLEELAGKIVQVHAPCAAWLAGCHTHLQGNRPARQ